MIPFIAGLCVALTAMVQAAPASAAFVTLRYSLDHPTLGFKRQERATLDLHGIARISQVERDFYYDDYLDYDEEGNEIYLGVYLSGAFERYRYISYNIYNEDFSFNEGYREDYFFSYGYDEGIERFLSISNQSSRNGQYFCDEEGSCARTVPIDAAAFRISVVPIGPTLPLIVAALAALAAAATGRRRLA